MKQQIYQCFCIICRKEYSTKGIHTHYTRQHIENDLISKAKRRAIAQKANKCSQPIHNQTQQNRILKYDRSPNRCNFCEKKLSFHARRNKFCSQSCSGVSSSQKRIDDGYKESVEMKMKRIAASKIGIEARKLRIEKYDYCRVYDTPCMVCNKIFYRSNERKACSKECRNVLFVKAGQKASRKVIRRSKDEIELFDLCQKTFINVLHNKIIADGWDADIILEDYKIAILWNGPWHYKEMNIGNHSLKQVQNRDRIKKELFESLGWQVLVFEDRYHTPETALENVLIYIKSAAWS